MSDTVAEQEEGAGRWPGCLLDRRELRLLLFGGKGGTGKTTCATATALSLAWSFPQDQFLLVSTDPAHSLADSLAGDSPPANLTILELDAQACLAAFKAQHGDKLRAIAWHGTFLDDEDISGLLDLSLPGLDELMAFLEITGWVEDGRYATIVVDTAPTGHTLVLLRMPELIEKWLGALDALLAKHRYLQKLFGGPPRRDELDQFLEELTARVQGMEALLQDPRRCRFIPVMLAEELSVRETFTLVGELERLRIPVSQILVNRLYPPSRCPVCAAGRSRQWRELSNIQDRWAAYTLWGIPLYPQEIRGIGPLTAFGEGMAPLSAWPAQAPVTETVPTAPCTATMYNQVMGPRLRLAPETKFLLFAGKGGVGKTTLACAAAVSLAQSDWGREVFLFSTDPAHSLSACLGASIGPRPMRLAPGLTALELDARAEFEALKGQYREELEKFLGSMTPSVDLPFDRQAMERLMDLSPPGLEEIMALTRAMELFAQGRYDLLIFDTAPTGHLLRLLELPELIDQWLKAFFGILLKYRQLLRLPRLTERLVQLSKDLKRLRKLLQDARQTALLAVAILTEMAFQETQDLVAACERLGVGVPAIFLNQATPESDCPLCAALYRRESQVKAKFQAAFPSQEQTVIYLRVEPRGLKRLGKLGRALFTAAVEENQHGAWVDLPALSS